MKKLTILLFLFTLSLPMFFSLAGLKFKEANFENRRKMRKPTWSYPIMENSMTASEKLQIITSHYKKYFGDFDTWVNDNLRLRPPLLDLRRFLYVDMLNRSPTPDRVVIGENGWLFLGDFYSDLIKESKGIKKLDVASRETMVRNAVRTSNELAAMGIDYYLAIAPNKHSVYGENLPIDKVGPSVFEVFESDIGDRIKLVDLKRDYDLEGESILYDRTNTHFNGLGAFESSNTLIKELQLYYSDVPDLQRDMYKVFHSKQKTDELTRMLRSYNKDEKINFMPVGSLGARPAEKQLAVPNHYPLKEFYEQRYVNEGKPYKVLIMGDSFMAQMFPYLKTQFGEVTFINQNTMNMAAVRKDRPDIVIQEIVERAADFILLSQ